MLMPPALLPQSAIGEFSASIFKLLEQRLSFDVIAFFRVKPSNRVPFFNRENTNQRGWKRSLILVESTDVSHPP